MQDPGYKEIVGVILATTEHSLIHFDRHISQN